MPVVGESSRAKVDVKDTLPGLYPAMYCGFNARAGNFLGEKLFEWPSEETGITWVAYGPNPDPQVNKLYPVPDGLQVQVGSISKQVKLAQAMESEADFSKAYSVKVNGKLSGLSYSAATSNSYAYSEHLFEKEHWVHRLDSTVISKYRAQRNESALKLTKPAIMAMSKLPLTLDTPAAEQQYRLFFDGFGTHYLKTASFGGHWVMRTDIHDSLMTKDSRTEVEGEVDAAFNTAVAEGNLKVTVDNSGSQYLKKNRSLVKITCKVVGGADHTTYDEWDKAVLAQPLPLLGMGTDDPQDVAPILVPISELTANLGLPAEEANARRVMMENALKSYLIWEPTSLLGFPVARDADTIRKAETAGFVMVNLREEHEEGGVQVRIKADSASHPKKFLGGGACIDQTLQVRQLSAATVPIPQNMYYLAESSLPSTRTRVEKLAIDPGDICFVPFMGQLDPLKEFPVGQYQAADTDGFMVGVAELKEANGSLLGWVQRPGAEPETLAGAAVGVRGQVGGSPDRPTFSELVSRTQSFCIPVCKGWRYMAKPVDGATGDWHAYWIPLKPPVMFDGDLETCIVGDRDRSLEGEAAQAETDGFLIAYLTVKSNDPGFVDMSLYVEPTSEELGNNYSKVRIRACHPTQRASFTLPVRKGQWYRAKVQCQGGSYSLKWIGLKRV